MIVGPVVGSIVGIMVVILVVTIIAVAVWKINKSKFFPSPGS